MKPSLYTSLAAFLLGFIRAEIPAFPGAEGFGGLSTGGRGGDVFVVRNLNPKGPGSFSEGVNTVPPEGRTIVFAVSGFIPINRLHLKGSNVTIAGQTAPGGGVCLRGSSLTISGSDVVIRHLRFRHGKDGNGGDCINPDGGADRLMLDHCDVMFSKDENFSSFRSPSPSMTFQWSTNAWGLQPHSCGGLWLVDHATAHHTLWANNHTRNPKVICPTLLDWSNNVTFAWDIGMNLAGADKGGPYRVNLRGSSFIYGGNRKNAIFGGGPSPDGTLAYHVYMNDCALDGNGSVEPDVTASDYAIIDKETYQRSTVPFSQKADPDPLSGSTQLMGVPLKVEDRITAFQKIISQVGPLRLDFTSRLEIRDEVTALLIKDLLDQKRRIIADPVELGLPNQGFGTLDSTPAPLDSDGDGMPDFWESTLVSDPHSDDHNQLVGTSSFFPKESPAGYTLLEEYLHFLAVPHGVIKPGRAVEIDLRRYTSGFVDRPVFTGSSITGGRMKSTGEGNHLVSFKPEISSGRAGFDFTVTDAAGRSWTQQCAILVTNN